MTAIIYDRQHTTGDIILSYLSKCIWNFLCPICNFFRQISYLKYLLMFERIDKINLYKHNDARFPSDRLSVVKPRLRKFYFIKFFPLIL